MRQGLAAQPEPQAPVPDASRWGGDVRPMTGPYSPEARAFIETAEILAEPYNETITDLRAKLSAAEQERDAACESANHANASADHFRHHADRAEAALSAVQESLNGLDAAFAEWEESPNLYSPGFAVRFLREHLDAALAVVLSGETFRSRKRTTRFIKHNDGK